MLPRASVGSLFVKTVRNPNFTMTEIASRANVRDGGGAILVLGVVHAIFSLVLYLSGHAPRVGIWGLGSQRHYLWQAMFVIPLYLALFWIGGLVAHSVARRVSGTGDRCATLAVFGVAYAVPMTWLFLAPDLVVYLTMGFSAIGKAMRWYAPLAAMACLYLGTIGLSRVHRIGAGRALMAALLGFVAQALVGGMFLR